MPPFNWNLSQDHTMFETGFPYLEQLDDLPNTTASQTSFTLQMQTNLQLLALTFSSISVASAILAFYWFVQMRRSFRHHLIMLLIQSDMFKALWFLIYPIVVFSTGKQASQSFCQINGFFISLGIEASDFAILMIAIHSALYIFRPVAAAGEGGLYPYRRIAYVLWVILPVTSASLAFLDGSKAYESQGTYCYLPVRPFWYRLALSWIPRYAIIVLIFGIYAAIYFYVRYKFSNFTNGSQSDSNLSASEEQTSLRRLKRLKKQGIPETPPLAYNGLIPESRPNSFSQDRAAIRSIMSPDLEIRNDGNRHPINIASNPSMTYIEPQVIHNQDQLPEASSGFVCNSSSCNSNSSSSVEAVKPVPALSNIGDHRESHATAEHGSQQDPNSPRSFSAASTLVTKTNSSIRPFFNRRFSPRSNSIGSRYQRSVIGIFSALRHPEATPTPMASDPKLVNEQGQNLAMSEMARTRDRIRKQLRFLFIYPLVYIAMWLVPFINHVLQYNDKLALDPPYPLACATVIFVTLQCAVDCWLFSTREQPWQHMPSNEEGTFWGSLMFWRSGQRRGSLGNRGLSGPGRSRAEAEARMAYQRREEEAEAWRIRDIERKRIKAQMESGGTGDEGGSGRNWWDLEFDGPSMSPVMEENNAIDPEVEVVENDSLKDDAERTAAPDIELNSATTSRDNANQADP